MLNTLVRRDLYSGQIFYSWKANTTSLSSSDGRENAIGGITGDSLRVSFMSL